MKVKVTYEFDTIEEEFEFKSVQQAIDFRFAIIDYDNELRRLIKNGQLPVAQLEGLEKAREILYDNLNDRSVQLHD